jgi:hypothetical protein
MDAVHGLDGRETSLKERSGRQRRHVDRQGDLGRAARAATFGAVGAMHMTICSPVQ